MITPADYQLLDRYRTGECTAAERSRVQELIAADAPVGELIVWMNTLKAVAEQMPDSASPDAVGGRDVEAAWTVLARELAATSERDRMRDSLREGSSVVSARDVVHVSQPRARQAPGLRLGARRSQPLWRSPTARIAAVLVLGVGSLIFGHEVRYRTNRVTTTAVLPVAMRTYMTQPGQRAEVQLIDGSRVFLGVGSTIRVPEDYGERSRDLFVDGDAYFEVAHDPRMVFRVHARNTVMQDIGTKFAVHAYDAESTVAIIVAEGSVSVKLQNPGAASSGSSTHAMPVTKEAVLQSRDLLRVSSAGAMKVRHGVDVAHYLAWTEGRIEFRDESLGAVAVQLSRWYDIDMRLRDPALASRRVTMSLHTESIAETLRLLEAAVDLRAQQNGRVIILSPR